MKRIDRSRHYLNLKTSAEVVNDVVNSAKIQVLPVPHLIYLKLNLIYSKLILHRE